MSHVRGKRPATILVLLVIQALNTLSSLALLLLFRLDPAFYTTGIEHWEMPFLFSYSAWVSPALFHWSFSSYYFLEAKSAFSWPLSAMCPTCFSAPLALAP